MFEVDYNICSGCGACKQVCPMKAIDMIKDSKGFVYPFVDKEKCIDCQVCEQICPQKKKYEIGFEKLFYAGRNKDENTVKTSSSGGVFDALAKMTFDNKGTVYAVGLDNGFKVKYYKIDKYSEIDRLRGSKYVEASISDDIMESLFDDISNGRNVLFVGTSCMVAGLIEVCEKKKLDTSKVIFCDFFYCSGNASPLLWDDEVKRLSREKAIKDISFRNKKWGWRNFAFNTTYKDNKNCGKNFLNSSWGRVFGMSSAIRPNCNNCSYNYFVKKSDISLGDFWNSYAIPKEWKDNKGVSLVSVNSDKGLCFLKNIENYATLNKVDKNVINWIHSKNEVVDNSGQRKEFWDYYNEYGYRKLLDKYCKVTVRDIVSVSIIRNVLIKTRLIELIDKRKKS